MWTGLWPIWDDGWDREAPIDGISGMLAATARAVAVLRGESMATETDYQLIFRNATIVDGTGGPVTEGDVAVRDGLLTQVGGHVGGPPPRRWTAVIWCSPPASSIRTPTSTPTCSGIPT